MSNSKNVSLFVIALLVSPALLAYDYKCSVKSATKLSGEGLLNAYSIYKPAIGNKFVIDRVTGRMIGNPPSNANAFGSPNVINQGSDEFNFKAITVYENSHTDVLLVRSIEESTEKPFIFLTGDHVITGTCVEF
jgi:hypothetical protein